MKTTPLTRVIAALLAAPLAMSPALAQTETGDAPATEQGETTGEDTSAAQSGSADAESGSTGMAGQSATGMDAEQLIATVDGSEITAGDVQAAINGLPPQMRERMPDDMLASMAVDQLVLRRLILDEAESQNLSEDPEVQQLIEENERANEEDAMLQVFVQRELEGAVTDEAVQETYDEVASQSEQEVPPLEEVRPQIEQQLRQQRLAEVRDELMQDVEIVYYGPDGEPMEASAEGEAGGMSGSDSSSSSEDGGTDGSGSGTESSTATEGGDMESEGTEDGSTTSN